MANPHKGEVSFEAGGVTYTLHYSTNALCEMEAHFGRSFVSIFTELEGWATAPEKIAAQMVRTAVRFGLRDNHPDLTEIEVGKIIDAYGGVPIFFEVMVRAMVQGIQPTESNGAAPETKGARPSSRKPAPVGTGLNS